MSLIKKKDVRMYFSERHRKGLHLVKPVAKLPATQLPVSDLSIEEDTPGFVDDFSFEHSSPGGTASAIVIVEPCVPSQAPELPDTSQL
jgi:hypothetical protein